jgi:phasin family protein
MARNVDDIQKLGKDNMDAAMKSFDVMSKGFQAIAAEVMNYSKRSLEDHTAAMQNIMGAKSPEKAFEIQSEYLRTASEGFMAEATKIGELYAALAKELYKPIGRNYGSN